MSRFISGISGVLVVVLTGFTLVSSTPRAQAADIFGAYMENSILTTKLAGHLAKISYPGSVSGLSRSVYIYTPPGYSAANTYPVLVLLHGTPGGPQDWPYKGNAHRLLDEAIKAGRFPASVVVFADGRGPFWKGGSEWADSADGRYRMETNVAVDLPRFLMANYSVSRNPSQWTVGGLSEGGFGAANIVLHYPNVYRNALVLSGDFTVDPEWPDTRTVFGNDTSLMARYSPSQQVRHLSQEERRGLRFYIAVGADDDTELIAGTESFVGICRGLGIPVHFDRDPGKHKWDFWSSHLSTALTTLAAWLQESKG